MPQKAQRYARRSLLARNIEIIEGVRVSRLDGGLAVLEDDQEVAFDLALLAWGIKPSHLFSASGLPTANDGGLLVNAYLQSIAYPEIFGGGDCISFEKRPLDKVGGIRRAPKSNFASQFNGCAGRSKLASVSTPGYLFADL